MSAVTSVPDTMPAAVLYGRRDLRIETVPVPRPAPGEVLLRVGAVGLCGTDASEYALGPKLMPVTTAHPMVIGHEFSGWVVAVGDGVDPSLRGRLVASCGAGYCLSCWQCERGRTNLCVRYAAVGLHRHGAAAHYVTSPLRSCVPADVAGLTADAAALVQPMSIAVHARSRGRAAAGERALLLGAGGIGAFLTYALARAGTRLAVVDPEPDRRELAARLGADSTGAPGAEEELTSALGGPPHVVFEASGTTAGRHAAWRVLPPGGRLVLVGLQKRPAELDLLQLTLTELELIGTNAMQRQPDFDQALVLVAGRSEGWADVAPTALPLGDLVADGLEPLAAGRPPSIKVLIDPWAEGPRAADTRPRAISDAPPARPPTPSPPA